MDKTKAISFDQFVEYGRSVVPNELLVFGMPWAFEYDGHPVTHEHDELYLISMHDYTLRFEVDQILVTTPCGELFVVDVS